MKLDNFHYLEKPDLFENFKIQITKDFELCGFLEYAPKLRTNDLNHVYEEILKSVHQLGKRSSSNLMNLLYRIDLSELQIKQMNQTEPKKSFEEIITIAIIKRILQKVVFKHLYS